MVCTSVPRLSVVALLSASCAFLLASCAFSLVSGVHGSSVSAPSPSAVRVDSMNTVTVVRNVAALSRWEKAALVAGMHAMKKIPSAYDSTVNAWDYFVGLHRYAVTPNTLVHAAWRFFPWHRELVNRMTRELRRATGNASLSFPYWDWANPASTAALMDIEYVGGSGRPQDRYVLKEGNFRAGRWVLSPNLTSLEGEAQFLSLLRAHGNGVQMCLDARNNSFTLDTPYNPPSVDSNISARVGPFRYLPPAGPPSGMLVYLTPDVGNSRCSWTDLACVRRYHGEVELTCKHYAATLPVQKDYDRCIQSMLPYTSGSIGLTNMSNPFATEKDYYNPYLDGFRPCFEGIDPSDPYAMGFERLGASLHPPHGATHTYLGGSMATPTSPNDPIFAHLHWNVDRMWAVYQAKYGNDWFLTGPGAPHVDEELPGFSGVTARMTLNYTERYNYVYDSV